MIQTAPRFTTQPHPFIKGATLIRDHARRHPLAYKVEWTEARPLTIAKAFRMFEEEGSLSDVVTYCDGRAKRLQWAKMRRARIQGKRRFEAWLYA